MVSALWRWVKSLFVPPRNPNDFRLAKPLPLEGPRACPRCLGRLEQMSPGGGQWVCRGWKTGEEGMAMLRAEGKKILPLRVEPRPPCGFTGEAAEYGSSWS